MQCEVMLGSSSGPSTSDLIFNSGAAACRFEFSSESISTYISLNTIQNKESDTEGVLIHSWVRLCLLHLLRVPLVALSPLWCVHGSVCVCCQARRTEKLLKTHTTAFLLEAVMPRPRPLHCVLDMTVTLMTIVKHLITSDHGDIFQI